MQKAGSPRNADARSEAPLAAGKRGVADTFGGKFLVIAGDDDADVGDGVGAEIVAVVLGIEIGEQAVLFDERTVPIPAKTGDDREIGFEAESILTESANLIRAVVAVGFPADKDRGTVLTAEHAGVAEIALEKIGKRVEVEQALIAVLVDDVELAAIELDAANNRVAADCPGIFR